MTILATTPPAYARKVRAAQRRVQIARARADRNPTPANREAAAQLEAGLARIQAQAAA